MEALLLFVRLLPLGAEESKRGNASEGDGTGTEGEVLLHRILNLVLCDMAGKCHWLGALFAQGSVLGGNDWLSDLLGCLLLLELPIDGFVHLLDGLSLCGIQLFKTLLDFLVELSGLIGDVISHLRQDVSEARLDLRGDLLGLLSCLLLVSISQLRPGRFSCFEPLLNSVLIDILFNEVLDNIFDV